MIALGDGDLRHFDSSERSVELSLLYSTRSSLDLAFKQSQSYLDGGLELKCRVQPWFVLDSAISQSVIALAQRLDLSSHVNVIPNTSGALSVQYCPSDDPEATPARPQRQRSLAPCLDASSGLKTDIPFSGKLPGSKVSMAFQLP
jgi:hypothetical protein